MQSGEPPSHGCQSQSPGSFNGFLSSVPGSEGSGGEGRDVVIAGGSAASTSTATGTRRGVATVLSPPRLPEVAGLHGSAVSRRAIQWRILIFGKIFLPPAGQRLTSSFRAGPLDSLHSLDITVILGRVCGSPIPGRQNTRRCNIPNLRGSKVGRRDRFWDAPRRFDCLIRAARQGLKPSDLGDTSTNGSTTSDEQPLGCRSPRAFGCRCSEIGLGPFENVPTSPIFSHLLQKVRTSSQWFMLRSQWSPASRCRLCRM